MNIDVVVNAVMLLVISGFLLIKALVFRRRGPFGEALAKSNVAISIAYIGALAAIVGLDFFRSTIWAWGIRAAVMFTVVYAGNQMAKLYGGWENLLLEVWLTLREYGDGWRSLAWWKKMIVIALLAEFVAAVVLTEIKGLPPEITPRSMTVTPTPASQQNEETQ